MDWERARKPEQKAERRAAIIEAARGLFSERAYSDISLNGIARAAGFSKPNVYRYFATREEIFLVIFQAEQVRFVDAFVRRVRRIKSDDVVDAICRAWVDVALKHEVWLDLLPQLAMSVEHNSSVEQIVKFKRVGYAKFNEIVVAVHSAHPVLDTVQWTTVMTCAYSLAAGLWPFCNPGANITEALRHPDVNQPVPDFRFLMTRALKGMIAGAEAMR